MDGFDPVKAAEGLANSVNKQRKHIARFDETVRSIRNIIQGLAVELDLEYEDVYEQVIERL